MRHRDLEQLFLITADGKQLALNNGKSRAVLRIGNRGTPPMNLQTITNTVGSSVQGYQFEPRNIPISLTDGGGSMDDYYRLKDKIINIVRPNRGGPMTLRSMRPGVTRDIIVYNKDGSPEFSTELDRVLGYVETFTLYAPDPFFYDPEQVSILFDGPPTSGFGFPYGFPYGFGAGAFVTESITYTGNVESYPIITITGPYTILNIIHKTLNVNLALRRALAVGETLTIDLSGEVVTVVDNSGINRITDIRDANTLGFYLGPESVDVPGGVNEFMVSGVGATGATTITFTYYNRYLSVFNS